MKKYNSLAELLIDYRVFKNMTQLDLSILLNVDTRTINRWEKGVSLIKTDKEDDIVEKLFLPHQVVHNLNSEHPISIFYDMESRTYSLSLLGTKITETALFKSNLPVEEGQIHVLSPEDDIAFVNAVRELRTKSKPLKVDLIQFAADVLPELNLVLFDQAGFNAGHVSFLALKKESLEKLRSKELKEEDLTIEDLDDDLSDDPKLFYFYSLYADSIANAYYLMHRVLDFFRKNAFKDYKISGMSYREEGAEMHKEMGLSSVWEEDQDSLSHPKRIFMEGNYDMFLFGKMT